jgi:hypothetical protein
VDSADMSGLIMDDLDNNVLDFGGDFLESEFFDMNDSSNWA